MVLRSMINNSSNVDDEPDQVSWQLGDLFVSLITCLDHTFIIIVWMILFFIILILMILFCLDHTLIIIL